MMELKRGKKGRNGGIRGPLWREEERRREGRREGRKAQPEKRITEGRDARI